MATAIPRPSQQVVNVEWLDINSDMGLDLKPDLLPNVLAINNGIRNLFRCPVGARGPIFDPEYGTIIYRLLHEPLDYFTANKLRAYLIQALQKWEPRITLDMANTTITPVKSLPGYHVKLTYMVLATGETGVGNFSLSVGG